MSIERKIDQLQSDLVDMLEVSEFIIPSRIVPKERRKEIKKNIKKTIKSIEKENYGKGPYLSAEIRDGFYDE